MFVITWLALQCKWRSMGHFYLHLTPIKDSFSLQDVAYTGLLALRTAKTTECLFELRLYSQSTIFQSCLDVFLNGNQY